MTYELEFDPRAWREWQKPGETVKKQFKNKLQQIVQNPRIESARLSDLPDCYKIKLKASGYRLVYQVRDRGSKRESQKIPSFRMMKIQSTPRLT